jgi:hypothetical protein
MSNLMFPKPHKLTDKEKYEKKLAQLKAMKDRQIQKLREGKAKQVKKAGLPKLSELKRKLQTKINSFDSLYRVCPCLLA